MINEELIKLKIEKSLQTLGEVDSHIENGFLSTAMNRIYYAGFYIVSALALLDGFSTSKHRQLIGYFNREYIQSEKLDRSLGFTFQESYQKRIIVDYHDFVF